MVSCGRSLESPSSTLADVCGRGLSERVYKGMVFSMVFGRYIAVLSIKFPIC